MGVINASCQADQATLAALYKHKAECFAVYKKNQRFETDVQRIFAMKRLAERKAAVAAIQQAHGEAYHEAIKARLIALTEARKKKNAELLTASQAKLEALKCLEGVA